MTARHPRDSVWAPWWAYAVVAVSANVLRLAVLPPSRVGSLWTITLFFVVLAATGAVVTAAHALVRRARP